MTAYPWRPLGSKDLDQLQRLVRTALEDWEQRWFGRDILAVSEGVYLPDSAMTPISGQDQHTGLGVRINETSARLLCQAALNTEARPAQELARQIVETLCAAISTELVKILRQRFGDMTQSSSGLPGIVQFQLCLLAGDASIDLEVGVQQALQLLSGTQPPAETPPSTPIREALDGVPVGIEALLGTAVLTLGELKSLEAGDIIRLDTHLEQPAGLRLLAGKRKVEFGTAHIKQSNGAFSLEIDSLSSRS
ncbi:FliM/FliN family flagellar motor C-terminal domain-containing protein [Pigmentiphaga sp. GD03639]|uniref:FliM/FliN family flagellar motor C-terminal domain-containing protein n=1 Tax=Pigmentiphaga sp. GD03639 TaxID=2975354 RepID=UPI00244C958E|nr:FliM/FliN family flagellar motor C-terminal domain-containing protein [Pigmentiphaga sp. GD03639]MDH2239977.1 FliM/FliN family flagellar motor C-terminal domain-containing protein [Pigmentiphaga sp. GD03639]